jgi:hypothetical protein
MERPAVKPRRVKYRGSRARMGIDAVEAAGRGADVGV